MEFPLITISTFPSSHEKKITKRQKPSFFFSMNLMTYFNSRTIITWSFFSLQPMCRCVNFPSDYFVNYIKSVQRMIASESCQVYLCEPHKQTKIVHKKSNENFCRVEQVSLMNLFFCKCMSERENWSRSRSWIETESSQSMRNLVDGYLLVSLPNWKCSCANLQRLSFF